jgi:predicted transposase/invertase (TIGR01784 family)
MIPFDTGQEVVEIEYLSSELVPALDLLKNSVVDVRCKDSAGRHFIVEMQLCWHDKFRKRVLHNASKVYSLQLEKGKKIELLQPVFSLNFINHIFEHSTEMENEYLHHYKIVNILHTEKQIEGLEFIFVELPKFKPENKAEKKLHELWMRFLTEIDEDTEESPPELLACPETKEALDYIERSAYTPEQLDSYLSHKVNASIVVEIQEEERRKGKEEGKAELRIEVARKALAAGVPVETVAQLTGLTTEQVIAIKQSHQ